SRRRHTRSLRDWSSDVCSSDLAAHPLAYHFLVGPVLAGQVLINHHHRIASDAVLIGEIASGAQGNAEGSEVSGTDKANVAVRAEIGRASCRERVGEGGVGG